MDNCNTIKKSVFINKQFSDDVNENGYVLAGNIGGELVLKMSNIYEKHHNFTENPEGLFHTLFSTDLHYRNRLDNDLRELLKPTYEKLFINFKYTAVLIVAKFFGQNSAFEIHQDNTIINEIKFTPLTVWIPLQDTTLENGCLCVVPKSQKFAFPYRGISFKGQFQDIENEIKPYLFPIFMKAGDVLIFDNRMFHYSPPNLLNKPRVVAMNHIFHEDAEIITCFKKDEYSPIEIYKQTEDYLLTYKDFRKVPTFADSGVKINEFNIIPPMSNKEDFLTLVKQYSLKFYNIFLNL